MPKQAFPNLIQTGQDCHFPWTNGLERLRCSRHLATPRLHDFRPGNDRLISANSRLSLRQLLVTFSEQLIIAKICTIVQLWKDFLSSFSFLHCYCYTVLIIPPNQWRIRLDCNSRSTSHIHWKENQASRITSTKSLIRQIYTNRSILSKFIKLQGKIFQERIEEEKNI